jgi:hypothetical protein
VDLRTFLFGALVFAGGFIAMVFVAPEYLKNEPGGSDKSTRTVKAEPLVDAPMDVNDRDNDAPAEEMSAEQAEAEEQAKAEAQEMLDAGPFGEN